MKSKIRRSLALFSTLAVLFCVAASGNAFATQAVSSTSLVDDCSSLNLVTSRSSNLQVFPNHPESGLSVISKTNHEEGYVRYAPSGKCITALQLSFQGATGFFSLSGSVRVEAKTVNNSSYTTVSLTQTGATTINSTFQKFTATASLPVGVTDVKITLIGINWTCMLDNVSMTLSDNSRVAFYQSVIQQESQWLLSLQLSNGAISMTNDTSTRKINPYFAEMSVLALLDSGSTYATQARSYIDWHFAHLNTAAADRSGVDGTIYDYVITVGANNVIQSEQISTDAQGNKLYDSTDSYAALFLSVLWRYYEVTGNAAFLQSRYTDIERIVNALFATMNNGLTRATPQVQEQYFMDNAEVWRGLADAAKMYEQVLVPGFAAGSAQRQQAESRRTQIATGRDQVSSKTNSVLWNETGGYYHSYCVNSTTRSVFSWNEFYPSSSCQAFAITTGLLAPDSARAKRIWNNFNAHYSTGAVDHRWEYLDIPDAFYWGSFAYAAALVGDIGRVNQYMDTYMAGPGSTHAWPLYNADAAQVVRAAHTMLRYYQGV